MAPKGLVLAALLVLVSAVSQVPHGAEAALADIVPDPSVLISGIVRCRTTESSTDMEAVPDVSVKLVCAGKVAASVSADDNGVFIITLLPNTLAANDGLLAALLADQCKVVAATPQGACKVSLPGATALSAPLQLLGASAGLVTVIGGHAVTIVGGILSFVVGVFSAVI